MRLAVPLPVRDLVEDDLVDLAWSGQSSHLASVAAQLGRAIASEVDYLAVCGPVGQPLGIGGVDFGVRAGVGTLYQLAVLPALQSCGLGSVLIGALAERAAARGLGTDLAVGTDNLRARALYERLGYRAVGSVIDRWSYRGDDGRTVEVAQACVLMTRATVSR